MEIGKWWTVGDRHQGTFKVVRRGDIILRSREMRSDVRLAVIQVRMYSKGMMQIYVDRLLIKGLLRPVFRITHPSSPLVSLDGGRGVLEISSGLDPMRKCLLRDQGQFGPTQPLSIGDVRYGPARKFRTLVTD